MTTYWLLGEKNTPSTSEAEAVEAACAEQPLQLLTSVKANTPSIVREMVSTPSLEEAEITHAHTASVTSEAVNGSLGNDNTKKSTGSSEVEETTPLLVSNKSPGFSANESSLNRQRSPRNKVKSAPDSLAVNTLRLVAIQRQYLLIFQTFFYFNNLRKISNIFSIIIARLIDPQRYALLRFTSIHWQS